MSTIIEFPPQAHGATIDASATFDFASFTTALHSEPSWQATSDDDGCIRFTLDGIACMATPIGLNTETQRCAAVLLSAAFSIDVRHRPEGEILANVFNTAVVAARAYATSDAVIVELPLTSPDGTPVDGAAALRTSFPRWRAMCGDVVALLRARPYLRAFTARAAQT